MSFIKPVNTELPKDSVAILESSFNIDNPYPSKEQKEALGVESGLSYNQVGRWFERQRKKEGDKKHKDITLVRGTKSFELRDKSLIGIGLCKTQNGFVYFGDITPDSQADRAGIISGDVPLENGMPIEYDTFLAMAAKRPLVFDVKRYAYQQFYTKSSPAYIHPQQLSLFNAGERIEMLKTKIEQRLEDKEEAENKKKQHDQFIPEYILPMNLRRNGK